MANEIIERAAKRVYDMMPYDGRGAVGTKPPWTERGNSLRQEEARRYCIAVMKELGYDDLRREIESLREDALDQAYGDLQNIADVALAADRVEARIARNRTEALERVSASDDRLVELVDEQSRDEALWAVPVFGTQSISEAYIQQALRDLHAAVERNQ